MSISNRRKCIPKQSSCKVTTPRYGRRCTYKRRDSAAWMPFSSRSLRMEFNSKAFTKKRSITHTAGCGGGKRRWKGEGLAERKSKPKTKVWELNVGVRRRTSSSGKRGKGTNQGTQAGQDEAVQRHEQH